MSRGAGALLTAVGAAIVLLGAGCVPVGGPPSLQGRTKASPPAVEAVTFEAEDGAFTVELPPGWNDLTAEYTERFPDTVLAAFWSTGPELSTPLTPFASVSVRHVEPGLDLAREVDEDLEGWRMTDPVLGVGTGLETDAGGRGMWRAVRGDIDGVDTTIYSIHISDGSLKLMVLIQTYFDFTEAPEALIEALRTVRFADVS